MDQTDPTVEVAYWQEHYAMRPYHDESIPYEQYRPAYRHGWEARADHANCSFEEVEAVLRNKWQSARRRCQLSWDKARLAARDTWDRVDGSCWNTPRREGAP
jgi:hypothetical protein